MNSLKMTKLSVFCNNIYIIIVYFLLLFVFLVLHLDADLGSILSSTNITEDDVKALLEGFGLSEDEAQAFVRQALDLLSKFGAFQNKSNGKAQKKVQKVLHQWSLSSVNVESVLNQVEALLGQTQQLIKSGDISTADGQAILEQLLAFSSDLDSSVTDLGVAIDTAVEDLENYDNISDADAMALFNEATELFNSLGISKADVDFALEVVNDFFENNDIKAAPSLIEKVYNLLVDLGLPTVASNV